MRASRHEHSDVSAEPCSSRAWRPGWFARRRRYAFALRHAPVAPGARVIDVGGGDGSFGVMLLAAGAAHGLCAAFPAPARAGRPPAVPCHRGLSLRLVVIQGSMSQEAWVAPEHERELCGPVVGLPRGMIRLLEASGFASRLHAHRRHPVAVGVR